MISKTIESVQNIERQIRGKSTEQLNARVAIRACLAELRSIAADEGQSLAPAQDQLVARVLPFTARAAS